MNILFFSPHALLDSTSGAAQSVRSLLAEWVDQGHSCVAVTGSIVDRPNPLLDKALAVDPVDTFTVTGAQKPLPVRRVELQGVVHYVLEFGSTRFSDLRATDEVALRQLLLKSFTDFKPNALLTFGGFISNFHAGFYAQAQGCEAVMYAGSPALTKPEHVHHVSKIICNSQALADQIAPLTEAPILPLAPFVRPEDVVSETRSPEYITVINPAPEKGLKIAVAIAAACQAADKPHKFLFVEGRSTKDDIVRVCPELGTLSNVVFAKNTTDVRKIYEVTRLVLFPSLWNEPAGRVVLEANANGIPVLAHRIGGVEQMLDGAGYLFDPPPTSLDSFLAVVPDDTVTAWLDVIDRLHTNKKEQTAAERRAKKAAGRYDPAKLAQEAADFISGKRKKSRKR